MRIIESYLGKDYNIKKSGVKVSLPDSSNFLATNFAVFRSGKLYITSKPGDLQVEMINICQSLT